MSFSKKLGVIAGFPLGVVTGVGAWVRGTRFFHPRGQTFIGSFKLVPEASPDYLEIARRLEGPVLMRLSNALWKRESSYIDVLGLALRFQWHPGGVRAEPFQQDLLFATILHPLTLFIGPFTTNLTSFAENHYYAVSPFVFENSKSKLKFRISPLFKDFPLAQDRETRFLEYLKKSEAEFVLEGSSKLGRWLPVGRIAVQAPIEIDQSALIFDPFLNGCGLKPVGFIHGLRVASYWASQTARRLRTAQN